MKSTVAANPSIRRRFRRFAGKSPDFPFLPKLRQKDFFPPRGALDLLNLRYITYDIDKSPNSLDLNQNSKIGESLNFA